MHCDRGAVVQCSSGNGSKLRIDPFGPITYDIIPLAIRFAISNGWTPAESGPAFWIGYTCIEDHRYRFVLRNADDPPFWSDPHRARVVSKLISKEPG